MKVNVKWLMLAALVALSASCTTPAKLAYLRDLEYDTPYLAKQAPELRLQVDDKISIQVFSTDAELAAPFNVGSGMVNDLGQRLSATTYTVDKHGNINFPVLGSMHIQGKTLNEVKEWVSSEIIRMGYIREPIVNVAMENFTITVLGETGESVMPVQGSTINILQVIARSSGTSQYSKIPDVMVIRTEEGVRMAYSVNLQSKSLFDSPAFYLRQNDIVYVKPRGFRTSGSLSAIMNALSPAMTAASVISTILILAKRL